MHKEELRLQMDVAIGRSPPLTEDQLQGRLRKEARDVRDVSPPSPSPAHPCAVSGTLLHIHKAGSHKFWNGCSSLMSRELRCWRRRSRERTETFAHTPSTHEIEFCHVCATHLVWQ